MPHGECPNATSTERRASVPIVHECSYGGCVILTMGEFCVEHERAAPDLDVALLALAVATGKDDTEDHPSS
jgi:hypothetical protein